MSSLLEEYQQLKQELFLETREPWQPLTTKTVDEHFKSRITTEMLMNVLYLSHSDTSISSNETICLDEL